MPPATLTPTRACSLRQIQPFESDIARHEATKWPPPQIHMSQIPPPERFDFSRPNDWPKWSRRFERFRYASGLSEKDEPIQVHTLIYSMGDEADDILKSFGLSQEDQKIYATVLGKFDGYFVKRKNTIFERARFNQRKQEEGEPVDDYIMNLYRLAEHCGYGVLHDEMIRDRIVVGLRDVGLSEKLQMNADLDLDKAIKAARHSESIKQQQILLRNEFRKEQVVDALVRQPLKPSGSLKGSPGEVPHLDNHNQALRVPSHALDVEDPLLTADSSVRPGRRHATSVAREGISRPCVDLVSVLSRVQTMKPSWG